jgi:class 3 adenylate cyclase
MAKMQSATWAWHFDQPPEAIWPALADSARFNEAAELPRYSVEETPQPDGTVLYTGRTKMGPFSLEWREVPVDWVQPHRFRHARLFRKGPLKSMVATLTLTRDGGGCRADYLLEAAPANLIGRAILAAGFFKSAGKTFQRLVSQTNDFVAGKKDQPFPFKPAKLGADARARLAAMAQDMEQRGIARDLVQRLSDYIVAAPELDLAHIRPLRLARLWKIAERDAIELCLVGVKSGMLALSWELLCPNCRGPKLGVTSLDRLPQGAHCGTCNIDYARDFARNVELTFHPVPSIRPLHEGEFCLFGPMTTPHVVAQQTLAAGESRDVPAALAFGDYRLRGLHPGSEAVIAWVDGEFPSLVVDGGGVSIGLPSPPGTIRFVNRTGGERSVVIESRDWVRDALTAQRVTTMQAFRDLFATEALRPGDQVGVENVTLMFTDLRGSTALYARIGDARAYSLVREHFAYLTKVVRAHDGGIVKTIGDAVMAAFTDPASAIKAALEVQRNVAEFNAKHAADAGAIVIKVGLHCGPSIAVTLNDRLDYFGSTVNLAARLQGQSRGGDIVLSTALAADPGVMAVLAGLQASSESAMVKGFEGAVAFLRLAPERLVESA